MIRLATESDLPAVTAIYEGILDEQDAGRAFVGWIRGIYPTEATARTAFDLGELFVLEENGQVLASARINREQMPAYAAVVWENDAPTEQVMVMHTLTVSPACFGQKLGPSFVAFYEQYALAHGCPYLRIDTNEQNTRARRLYAALGYHEAGIIPCNFNGIPDVGLVCLEKCLL